MSYESPQWPPPPPQPGPPPPGGAYGPPPQWGYGPPPQWGYGPPPLPRREHPDAQLILGFGIASLVSVLVLCGLLLPLAPIAWVKGNTALAEIAASQGTVVGDESVRAGRICGIIGTVLLGFWVVGVLALLVGIAAA